jgi:hypothetical protein
LYGFVSLSGRLHAKFHTEKEILQLKDTKIPHWPLLHLPYDEFLTVNCIQEGNKLYLLDPIEVNEPRQLIVLFLFTVATIACWLDELGFSGSIGRFQFEEIYVHEINPWLNFLTAMGLRCKLIPYSDEIIKAHLIRRINAG